MRQSYQSSRSLSKRQRMTKLTGQREQQKDGKRSPEKPFQPTFIELAPNARSTGLRTRGCPELSITKSEHGGQNLEEVSGGINIPIPCLVGIFFLVGERTLSMSCSDKLAKWSVMGVQGALLMYVFAEPWYIDSMIIGGK